MVDWREGAADLKGFVESYIGAARNTETVGKRIANFISNNNINPGNVTCIGHSLGNNDSRLRVISNI